MHYFPYGLIPPLNPDSRKISANTEDGEEVRSLLIQLSTAQDDKIPTQPSSRLADGHFATRDCWSNECSGAVAVDAAESRNFRDWQMSERRYRCDDWRQEFAPHKVLFSTGAAGPDTQRPTLPHSGGTRQRLLWQSVSRVGRAQTVSIYTCSSCNNILYTVHCNF